MLKVMVGFRMRDSERYEEVKEKCDEMQRCWDVNGNRGLFPFHNGAPSYVDHCVGCLEGDDRANVSSLMSDF